MNYVKLDSDHRRHHQRWKRRVESRVPRLVCQECRGSGGEVDVVLDYGQGPFIECGWCEGTGLVDSHRRSEWLRMRKEEISNGASQCGAT